MFSSLPSVGGTEREGRTRGLPLHICACVWYFYRPYFLDVFISFLMTQKFVFFKILKSLFSILLIISATSLLEGCMTITNQVQEEVTAAKNYPGALVHPSQISNTPPRVNVKDYQSVETSPTRPYQRSDIAVAVAVSGGGYRASNLLMGVLLGLEQYKNPYLKGNLLEEVDYFSTVSGGGFGVGYYLSRLNLFLNSQSEFNIPHFSLEQTFNQDLRQPAQMGLGSNSHKYTGLGNVLNIDQSDIIELGTDHYDAYEQTINQGVLDAGVGLVPGINTGNKLGHPDFTLGDVFIPLSSKKTPKLPLWVVNTTIYQNMAIMPMTPKILGAYGVSAYRHDGQNIALSQDPTNPNYGLDFPYSVALAASSSVPFAMRSTTLESNACFGDCYLQLFDGGLSDNLGVVSAYDLLMQDPAPTKLLIVVDAGSTHLDAFSADSRPPGVFSMLWQVMNSGITASRLLVRNNVKQLGRALMCQNGASNVLIVYLDLSDYPEDQDIQTSLYLTPDQQKELLTIGQALVKNNQVLQNDFPKFLSGDKSIGACPADAKSLSLGAYDVSALG